jgi:hypothetical protein
LLSKRQISVLPEPGILEVAVHKYDHRAMHLRVGSTKAANATGNQNSHDALAERAPADACIALPSYVGGTRKTRHCETSRVRVKGCRSG